MNKPGSNSFKHILLSLTDKNHSNIYDFFLLLQDNTDQFFIIQCLLSSYGNKNRLANLFEQTDILASSSKI